MEQATITQSSLGGMSIVIETLLALIAAQHKTQRTAIGPIILVSVL